MNHLKAKQRSDGRFDYTSSNDGRAHALGYCAGWQEYTPEQRGMYGMSETWWEEHQKLKDKYHTTGHATAKEAEGCYKDYLLDTSLRFSKLNLQHKCKVCNTYTQGVAYIGAYTVIPLCYEHCNRESLTDLYQVGESWES